MIPRPSRFGPAAAVLGLLLGGCQAFLPRDETPVLPPAFAVNVVSGPSSQRLDEDGYPMIGAYPSAAAAQAPVETVEATRSRFANAPARGTASTAGSYERSVRDLEATRARAAAAGQNAGGDSIGELRSIGDQQRQAPPATQ